MTRLTLLIVATLLSGLPAPATADNDTVTVKADFVMTRSISVLKQALTSKGRLMLGGKGRLRFETIEPSRSVIIINGGTGWLHYPELGVTKSFDIATDPMMKMMSEQLAALTKGDFAALGSVYRITEGSGGTRTLVPKDPHIEKLFKSLRVTLKTDGTVREVEMRSRNGDSTTLRFENAVVGAPLDAALFDNPDKQGASK